MHEMQGQVLNQTSAWWMAATQHIVPNALLAVPDPNISVMQKCSVFPVEFVVRGFMTGEYCRSCLQRWQASDHSRDDPCVCDEHAI